VEEIRGRKEGRKPDLNKEEIRGGNQGEKSSLILT
jgi:hypothetical protein